MEAVLKEAAARGPLPWRGAASGGLPRCRHCGAELGPADGHCTGCGLPRLAATVRLALPATAPDRGAGRCLPGAERPAPAAAPPPGGAGRPAAPAVVVAAQYLLYAPLPLLVRSVDEAGL